MSIKKTLGRVGIVLSVAVTAAIGQPNSVASVKIGDLTWTKQNLNIKTPDSWCYGNDISNCAKYGRLYTYEAAKKACQSMGDGWRLPTNEDWYDLMKAVGGVRGVSPHGIVYYENAGKKLKSKSGWDDYGGKRDNATDDYGFSGLPGGNRCINDYSAMPSGCFINAGDLGFWWSATESGRSGYADRWSMSNGYDDVNELHSEKDTGFSVRCSKN